MILLAVAMATAGTLLLPQSASSQYFGRNKVQYDDFDFRILETEHFRIHFYEDESEQAIQDAARMAERWYERLARTFQHAFRDRKPLILYANQPDFQQTNTISGPISQATGGVTESLKNRVILPFAESYGETSHVLGHELVHAFQYDIAQGRGGGGMGFQNLPLWAIEGLAEYLTLGRDAPHTAMWMRDAVLRDDLPTIEDLGAGGQYFPYRFGHALWAYIAGRGGDQAATEFYRVAARSGLESASRGVLGLPLDTLSNAWQADTREFYARAMEGRSDPSEVGSLILPQDEPEQGQLYISPSVSPDGSRVIYLAQEELFTIDLYIADARTGETLGRLASAQSDPHLDALAYTNSSGAWAPEGERFAYATYAGGDNEILVADVDDRRTMQRYELPGIGAVFSMDWSPDGDRIVFSGNAGGVVDLYALNVQTGDVEQLTDDRWAQLHPSYSPDGSTLAFSVDQGEAASLEQLRFVQPAIGLMDLSSGRVQTLRPHGDARHVNPIWSPDGSSLYFISDQDGFSDVYRLSLDDQSVRRVTHVATGVTGITALSPALTVARQGGDVLFTVFRDGGYMVRRLSAQEAGGEEVGPTPAGAEYAGILPPRIPTGSNLVSAYLDDPFTGLPAATAFEMSGYDSDLSLDYVTQPTAGVGVDSYGTQLGGGVAAFFSDMLGNRQLGVSVQANGGIQDIGGQVAYQNLANRANWSLVAGRIPYRTGFAQRGTTEVDGETLRTVDLVIDRTILNQAGAGVSYPFSVNRRIEFEAGATYIGFDRERRRNFYTPGGSFLGEEVQDIAAPESLLLYNASAALVDDRSFMAFTSPVRGSRYRIEATQNFGDLAFTNAIADVRRYMFANPVTFAVRAFHYGRYGGDADSGRMNPIYVGHGAFVRGYEASSFDAGECTEVSGEDGCPEFDRLVGSRIALAGAELRIPLNGTEQFGLLDWGYIPVELSLFGDAGVAWTSDEEPNVRFDRETSARVPVFSTGVSTRLNILGALVLEVYYAYPFQRPEKGWLWGFQIQPGW